MQNSFKKITFYKFQFLQEKKYGHMRKWYTENFGRLVSVPKKLLLLFPEKEPFP